MRHYDAMTYQHILEDGYDFTHMPTTTLIEITKDGYEISQTMTRVIAKIATEVADRGEISLKSFSDKVGIPYGNVRVYKSRYKTLDKTLD